MYIINELPVIGKMYIYNESNQLAQFHRTVFKRSGLEEGIGGLNNHITYIAPGDLTVFLQCHDRSGWNSIPVCKVLTKDGLVGWIGWFPQEWKLVDNDL